MSGILLIIILAIWSFVVKAISRLCVKNLQSGTKKTIIHIALFILFFIAPVADDIIGGFQFRAMCTPDNMLVYDSEKVRGKSIEYKGVSVDKIYKIIPIWVTQSEWTEPGAAQVLIVRKKYDAMGGWLSRLIGFPEGSPPYTFDGTCNSFKAYDQLLKKLNITEINN